MRQKLDIQEFQECTGEHRHGYPQILVPLQQSMSIRVGEAEYDVTCQELCFVPAGMDHQCGYRGRLLAINLSQKAFNLPTQLQHRLIPGAHPIHYC